MPGNWCRWVVAISPYASVAYDVSNNGIIAGYSSYDSGFPYVSRRAIIWHGDNGAAPILLQSCTDPNNPYYEGVFEEAFGISPNGQYVAGDC